MDKKEVEALKKEFESFPPLTDAERAGMVTLMCRNGFLKSIEIAAGIAGASTSACIQVLKDVDNQAVETYLREQVKQLCDVYKLLYGLTVSAVSAVANRPTTSADKRATYDKLLSSLNDVRTSFVMLNMVAPAASPVAPKETKETPEEKPADTTTTTTTTEETPVEQPAKRKRGRPRKTK